MRDGKRDKVKLDEFAAAVETAKNLAETNHFETVYVIDEADPKKTIGQTVVKGVVRNVLITTPVARPAIKVIK